MLLYFLQEDPLTPHHLQLLHFASSVETFRVDIKDKDGKTALDYVIRYFNRPNFDHQLILRLVKLLVVHPTASKAMVRDSLGALIAWQTEDHEGLDEERLVTIKEVLNQTDKFNPELDLVSGYPITHYAVIKRDLDTMKMVIECKQISPNRPDVYGNTVLFYAAQNLTYEAFLTLLNGSPVSWDYNAKNKDGEGIVEYCSKTQSTPDKSRIIRLVKSKQDAQTAGLPGKTAFYIDQCLY